MKPRTADLVKTFAWVVWARNRRTFVLWSGGFVGLAVLSHFTPEGFPAGIIGSFYAFGAGWLAVKFISIGRVGAPTSVVASATFPQTGAGPAFSADLTTRPVATRTLVWLPIVLGSLCFALLWGLYAVTTIIPLRLDLPVGTPMLGGAAILAWMHSLNWAANRGGCRPLVAQMFLAGGAVWLWFEGGQSESATILLLVLLGASSLVAAARYAADVRHRPAVRATAPTNPAESPEGRPKPARVAWRTLDEPDLDLATPWTAEVWRLRGRKGMHLWAPMLGVGILFALVFVGAALFFPSTQHVWIGGTRITVSGAPAIGTQMGMYALIWSLMVNSASRLSSQGALDPLTATRPMRTAELAGIRVRIAAEGASYALAMVTAAAVLYLIQGATDGSRHDILAVLLLDHYEGSAASLALVTLGAAYILLFSLRLELPVSSQTSCRGWMAILAVMTFLIAVTPLGAFMVDVVQRGAPTSPGPYAYAFAWDVFVLKGVYATAGTVRALRSKRVQAEIVRDVALIWLGVWLLLVYGFREVLPVSVPTLAIGLAVAILMPMNRLAWMIPNLDRRRHA